MSIQKWISDPSHSEISVNVNHLINSTISGYFCKLNNAEIY